MALRIGVDQVREMLAGPTPPLILDVRGDADYERSPERIAGDLRVSPTRLREALSRIPRNRPIVAY